MATGQANANIFHVLPPEIIYKILDDMWPDEYSGFSCTCRCALGLANAKFKNTPDDVSGNRDSTMSLTGAFVRGFREYKERWQSSGGCYTVDDDPDL